MAVWAVVAWPLLTGERTLVLRDVLTTHAPLKWFGAQQLELGVVPLINPTLGLGQPFAGNPNALPFYPGNALYLVLPFWSAFSAHYMLHWLLGFAGMLALAKAFGQNPASALLAAIVYAGSGFFVSLLTFYNLLAVAAWAPWVLVGLVRPGARSLALSGIACGLTLLGGEPLTAVLLVPLMALAACERRTVLRGLGRAAISGLCGVALALPQIVATLRVLPFSFRMTHGYAAETAQLSTLPPARWLELLWPLPWGWPGAISRFGYWSDVLKPQTPYFYSMHVGLVAALLALAAWRSRRRWAAVALGCLLLGWTSEYLGALISQVSGGLFRHPQKLLFPFTIAVALLAGWGLPKAMESIRWRRAFVIVGALLLAFAISGRLFLGPLRELLRVHLARSGDAGFAATAAGNWIVGSFLAALTLFAAAWFLRRGRANALVGLQLVALLQLSPAIATDSLPELQRASPVVAAITASSNPVEASRAGTALVAVTQMSPAWEARTLHSLNDVQRSSRSRSLWLNAIPAFGVPHGITYPMAPDLDGITSPLSVLLSTSLASRDWPARAAWMRRLGADFLVRESEVEASGLERVLVAPGASETVYLERLPQPFPRVRWPERLRTVPSPVHAFLAVARAAEAGVVSLDEVAFLGREVAHRPGGRVRIVSETADRLRLEVEGGGGLMVLQRAYLPPYRATNAEGTSLPIQPVDVALLGVEVPGGAQQVELAVDNRPEKRAGAFAGVVALVLFAIAAFHPFGRIRAQPAEAS